VIAGAKRDADGYAAEAVLVRLSEIGEPAWADELIFDSESDACTVRLLSKGAACISCGASKSGC
jgi:hypothetical protein